MSMRLRVCVGFLSVFMLASRVAWSLPVNFGRTQGTAVYEETVGPDFLLYHDRRARHEGAFYLATLERVKPLLERWLRVKRETPLPVVSSATTANASFANFLLDTVELQTLGRGDRELAWHEYMHMKMYLYFDNIFGAPGALFNLIWMPPWWVEGMAEAFSVSVGSDVQAGYERLNALSGQWPTWDRLHSLYGSEFSQEGYAVSGAFVAYLLNNYGANELPEFMEKFEDYSQPWWWLWAAVPFNGFMPFDQALKAYSSGKLRLAKEAKAAKRIKPGDRDDLRRAIQGKRGRQLFEEYKLAATKYWRGWQKRRGLPVTPPPSTYDAVRKQLFSSLSSLRVEDGRVGLQTAVGDKIAHVPIVFDPKRGWAKAWQTEALRRVIAAKPPDQVITRTSGGEVLFPEQATGRVFLKNDRYAVHMERERLGQEYSYSLVFQEAGQRPRRLTETGVVTHLYETQTSFVLRSVAFEKYQLCRLKKADLRRIGSQAPGSSVVRCDLTVHNPTRMVILGEEYRSDLARRDLASSSGGRARYHAQASQDAYLSKLWIGLRRQTPDQDLYAVRSYQLDPDGPQSAFQRTRAGRQSSQGGSQGRTFSNEVRWSTLPYWQSGWPLSMVPEFNALGTGWRHGGTAWVLARERDRRSLRRINLVTGRCLAEWPTSEHITHLSPGSRPGSLVLGYRVKTRFALQELRPAQIQAKLQACSPVHTPTSPILLGLQQKGLSMHKAFRQARIWQQDSGGFNYQRVDLPKAQQPTVLSADASSGFSAQELLARKQLLKQWPVGKSLQDIFGVQEGVHLAAATGQSLAQEAAAKPLSDAGSEAPPAKAAAAITPRGQPKMIFPWIGGDDPLGYQLGVLTVPFSDDLQNHTMQLTVLLGLESQFPGVDFSWRNGREELFYELGLFKRQRYNGVSSRGSLYFDETGLRLRTLKSFRLARRVRLSLTGKLESSHLEPELGPTFREGLLHSQTVTASLRFPVGGWVGRIGVNATLAPSWLNTAYEYDKLGASASLSDVFRKGNWTLGLEANRTRGPKTLFLREFYLPLRTFVPGSGGGANRNNFNLVGEGGLFGSRFGDTQARAKFNLTMPVIRDLDQHVFILYFERLDFSAFFNYGGAWIGNKLPDKDQLLAAHGYNLDLQMENKGVRFNVGIGVGQLIRRMFSEPEADDLQLYLKTGFDAIID